MPRLPTIRVIGSHDMSTILPDSGVMRSRMAMAPPPHWLPHRGAYPVVSSSRLWRHLGSLSIVRLVIPRSRRISGAYPAAIADDRPPPGGASMNGMNLSGKPGIVQPMQIPPTLGQPPIPAIQPRFGTLQFTTGPQQPIFTWDLGEL